MKAKLIKENNFYYLKVDGKIIADIDGHPLKSVNLKLSKQNCDEIFGAVDVEKLACDECHIDIEAYKIIQTLKSGKSLNEHGFEALVGGFIKGFNKAVELNKDKLFTIEDVKKAIEIAKNSMGVDNDGEYCYSTIANNEIIQSLQQPTEIEVEIEMEKYGYCEGCIQAGMWHCAHADTCGNAVELERPKLDNADCLILHRV